MFILKSSVVVIAVLFLAACTGLSGLWVGAGSVSDASGWSAQCPAAKIKIARTLASISVERERLECIGAENTFVTFRAVKFEADIDGNELWKDGRQVGYIDDHSLSARYCYMNVENDATCENISFTPAAGESIRYIHGFSQTDSDLRFELMLTEKSKVD